MSFANLPVQMFQRFIATPTDTTAPLTVKQSVTKYTYENNYTFAAEIEPKCTDTTTNLTNFTDISSQLSDMVDIDRESLPMTELLTSLTKIQEQSILAQNGFKKIKKICNTFQGELLEAEPLSGNAKYDKVTVKKCDKELMEEHITFADDDDMHFCVDDNIKKESKILKYLTIDNKPSDNFLTCYVDMFESENDYYFVYEYLHNCITLKEFVGKCHFYIEKGKLKRKEYNKIIKYIIWQLITTISWLHNDMSCCHLKLCIKNIRLQNADFVESANGYMIINSSITIKITDFSKTEVFKTNNENENKNNIFYCEKYCELAQRPVQYLSPKLYNETIYDARATDMWAIGHILYECIIGKPIYNATNIKSIEPELGSGRWAVMNGYIKTYLKTNNLLKKGNNKMFSLINQLLNINENERITAIDTLKHEWFKSYYKKYSPQIEKKSIAQQKKLKDNIKQNKMKQFPYYNL